MTLGEVGLEVAASHESLAALRTFEISLIASMLPLVATTVGVESEFFSTVLALVWSFACKKLHILNIIFINLYRNFKETSGAQWRAHDTHIHGSRSLCKRLRLFRV